jgi:hypothetical protein
VTRDHYAVLGVSPASEDVVIRAAYRALMRLYHPDADTSSEASQRAQAINAAYAVLGDPEKRARYDGSLAAQGLIKPEAPHRSSLARRMVPGPAGLIGIAVLGATATLIAISPPIGMIPKGGLPLATEPRPSWADLSESANPASGTQQDVPSGDAAIRSAVSPTNQVPNAMLEPAEELVEPGVHGPPAVQPARAEPPRRSEVKMASRPGPPVAQPSVARAQRPAVPMTEAAGTCRLGNGWADRTICSSSNLAALDRQHGMLYAQSWARADETKRAALLGSRGRFQQKRDACRSESCLTSAYVARLREISDIMARSVQQ